MKRHFQLDRKLYDAARKPGASWPTINKWLMHFVTVLNGIGFVVSLRGPKDQEVDSPREFRIGVQSYVLLINRDPAQLERLLHLPSELGITIGPDLMLTASGELVPYIGPENGPLVPLIGPETIQ